VEHPPHQGRGVILQQAKDYRARRTLSLSLQITQRRRLITVEYHHRYIRYRDLVDRRLRRQLRDFDRGFSHAQQYRFDRAAYFRGLAHQIHTPGVSVFGALNF
jgi:hypothetical protein